MNNANNHCCDCEKCLLSLPSSTYTQQQQHYHNSYVPTPEETCYCCEEEMINGGTIGGRGNNCAGGNVSGISNVNIAGGGCNNAGGGGSSATSTSSGHNFCLNGNQTIEDQIKHIDRIMKECDLSRKNLEQFNRRLEDLNDEVRRYREFLGHEKSRRDPAMYKTSNVEQPSPYNDSICGIIGTLTQQLALEWSDKLRTIQTQTLMTKFNDKN